MSKPKTIDSADKVKANDKIIAVMGPTGCGKSNFIDHITTSTKWSGATLRSVTQDVRAIRIPFFNANVVMVDTPGFDNTYRSDFTILDLIGNWLKKTYQNDIKLTGILYLHRITDNRMAAAACRNLLMFRRLCGDKAPSKVIFVTTMWDKILPDRGEQRELELINKYWEPILKLGAQTARFLQNNGDCAQNIVRRLLDSDTRATLLQEETVDLNRSIVETEAAKTVYSQLQILLVKHKETLVELREGARKMNNPQMLADLRKEEARIQSELDKTFAEAERLKIPLSQRIMLFFSGKTSGHPIGSSPTGSSLVLRTV